VVEVVYAGYLSMEEGRKVAVSVAAQDSEGGNAP
jgi:hypothetical protein